MSAIDWDSFKAHREYVVRTEGQWAGILDENGNPLFDLPPIIHMSAPETRLAAESLKISIPVEVNGRIHPAVSELMGENLGDLDGGKFVPSNRKTRLVVIERSIGERWAGKVRFSTATGGSQSPATLTIHALHVLDVLAELPCPAANQAWLNAPYRTLEADPVARFVTPREISLLTFADSADGFSEKGEAEAIIRKVITRAIDVVGQHSGWEKPHVVVDQTESGVTTPVVTMRITDDSIWNTVSETALLSGVNIRANLWLPGDPAVNGKRYDHPVIAVTIKGVEGG